MGDRQIGDVDGQKAKERDSRQIIISRFGGNASNKPRIELLSK
jgi:hypothetical protein